MALRDLLPEVYARLLSQDLASFEIIEKAIRCEPCLMSEEPSGYLNSVKCCSHFPFLPNFLLRSILGNSGSDSAFANIEQLQSLGMISPLGLIPPLSFRRRSQADRQERFGRDESLLCPFFEAGRCTIWENRPSVCASFYCQSSHGEEGLRFWKQLGDHFHRADWSLAQLCLVQGGFSGCEINEMLSAIEGTREDFTNLWPAYWRGREIEFFGLCDQWVREHGRTWLADSRIMEPELPPLSGKRHRS